VLYRQVLVVHLAQVSRQSSTGTSSSQCSKGASLAYLQVSHLGAIDRQIAQVSRQSSSGKSSF